VIDTRVSSLSCRPVAVGSSLPTASSTVCTGSYSVTQSDINTGLPLLNTATVSFTNAAAQKPTASVNVVQTKLFNLSKSVDKLTTSTAGDQLSYSVVVSNTGNTDLLNLQLQDDLVTLQCTPVANGGTLSAFTGTTTCTGRYTVTQVDINRGTNLVNTVTAALGGVSPKTATATTSILQNRALRITKTPSVSVVSTAGAPILYSIRVSNVGNVDLASLSVVDPRLPAMVCSPTGVGGTLLVGAGTTCTGTYTTLQSDINAGVPISNTATASAPQTSPVSAIASVNILQNAMFTATKTVNIATTNTSGTVLFYTITVTNSGNEDLTNLQVTDVLTNGNLVCTPVALGGVLTVTAHQTVCTTSYTVKQSDINAGNAIVNTAIVVTTQAGPVSVSATTAVVRTPSISIFKQASRSVATAAGQQIDYTVQLINSGNTDLQNLQVDDSLIDSGSNNLVCAPTAEGATLLVGSTTNCRGSYIVSQANINNGADIVNVAGVVTTQTPTRITAQATTSIARNPVFSITKKAGVTSVNSAGQQIPYVITLSNDGFEILFFLFLFSYFFACRNVDLQNMQVSDPRLGNTLTCGPVPIGATLTVAQKTTTCTGSYTTSQQDINAGQTLPNTVTAQFNPITSLVQPKTASASVNVAARPAISVTKVADRASVNAAGQVVTYTITVSNNGNQDLQNFQLSDSLIPASTLRCTPVNIGQTLTVSTKVTTCTGSYTVVQADINRGSPLLNTVIVQTVQTAPASAQATVNVVQSPAFSIAKTVDALTANAAGQRLRYSILVRNTGNQDLTNFNLQDPIITAVQNDLQCTPVARGQTLAVAQSTTCTGSYVTTQGDVNSGTVIVNIATASFQQAQPLSASVTTTIAQNAAMTLTKRANVASVEQLGSVITYTLVASNEGNVDLTNLQVTDNRVTSLSCSPVSVGGTLRVQQTTTCTGSYIVTQADLDAGVPLLNQAAASSTQTQPVRAIATVTVTQNASFNVTKTASVATVTAAGTVIQYAIQISNTGNENLLALRVTDPLISTSPGNNNLQCAPVALGQTLNVASPRTTCTGSYTVSQANIDSGDVITNVATVAFTQTPAQTALANTNVQRLPSFTLTKVASQGTVNAVGQTIRYTIRIANSGNTRLNNLAVNDFLVQTGSRDLSCSPIVVGGTLDVLAATTCTGTYVMTQSDINAGAPIVNTVTVQFTEAALQSASATTTITQSAAFTIAKTADKSNVDGAGQVIAYSVTIQNVGNVDLLNFQLSDPLVDGSSNNIRCTPVSEGASLTVAVKTTVCTGSYTVKQSDINAGQNILNVATASFNNAQPVSAQATTSVTQRFLLSITKAANRPTVSAAGDSIGYAVVVKNEGNTDLQNLQVRDDLVDSFANNLACSPVSEGAVLPVGVSTTCTGTYVTTQSNINFGAAIVNTAFAQALGAAQVTAAVTVNVVQRPSFSIVKLANRESVRAIGDVISWTVEVQVRKKGKQKRRKRKLLFPCLIE
jgi:uncharacterized repeat protein (TIGR01451 family)